MDVEGSISPSQGSCSGAGFVVQNSTGGVVASISSTGALCLKGTSNDYATDIK